MTEPEVGRKVRQLGQDVFEIYDLLDGIAKTQAQHGAALANLTTRFDGLETRVDALDVKFTGMFGELDAKFTGMFGGLETGVDALDAKFTGMFGELDAKFTDKFDSVDAKLDIVLERIGHGGV